MHVGYNVLIYFQETWNLNKTESNYLLYEEVALLYGLIRAAQYPPKTKNSHKKIAEQKMLYSILDK